AGAAVVGAHAAGADAAERQVAGREVQQGVVDGDAAGDDAAEDLLHRRAIAAEGVQRQRAVARFHVRDRLVEVAVAAYREDRAEDLVLHHARVVAGFEYDGRRDDALGLRAHRV